MNRDNTLIAEERKRELRELLANMEQIDPEGAISLADAYVMRHETGMFQEIGRITRTLHEALNAFQVDSRIIELTEHEIPDAKERLNYVIAMTEQSANKVLNAVEKSMPLAESLKNRAEALHRKWTSFRKREMTLDDFRAMTVDIDDFLASTGGTASSIHANLSEVIMAQDFQDLTGQIIKRVISMVQDVEESLVRLVRITGENILQEKKEQHGKEAVGGPAIPALRTPNQMTSQDEVDDLLSSLGF